MFYSHTPLDICSNSLVHISNCFLKTKNLNCEMADFSGFHREIIKMMLNLYIISRVTLEIQKLMKNQDCSVPSPFQNNNHLNAALRKRKWECNCIHTISHYFKLKGMEALFILLHMTQLRHF